MKKIFLLIFVIGTCLCSNAGTVDTIAIFSNSMHKTIKCVVIKPSNYARGKARFPVVYYLHGYGGSYSNCITRIPQLTNYADLYKLIIVCPDGAIGSWYFDSPTDTAYRYETHISTEVVGYIDSHFKTVADPQHRAICGLSMGGHGAMFLALRHPTIFGAAAAMSGGMDLTDSKTQFEIALRIGDTTTNAKYWHDWSIINLIEQYPNTPVKILFDCGNRDIFIESNRRLHQKMLALKIPHDYIERFGVHGWDYWRNSIPYQLLFFRNFFNNFK